MTTVITSTAQIDEMNKLKTRLVKETVQSLPMLKSNQFDLSTEEGIHYTVNCTVDNLLQQKIKNGEIQVIEQSSTLANSNGAIQ